MALFRSSMPTEYRQTVLTKGYAEGCDNETGPGVHRRQLGAGALLQRNKPAFEPTSFKIKYRFLEADRRWTEALFSTMRKNTYVDQPFGLDAAGRQPPLPAGRLPRRLRRPPGQAQRGGTDHAVTNPTVGDKIDAFDVEDWVFATRNDKRFGQSFRDVETGKRTSARFINPDPGAYFDPFYTRTGKRDLDRAPQGAGDHLLVLRPEHVPERRRRADGQVLPPSAYHFFDVSEHMVVPDRRSRRGPERQPRLGRSLPLLPARPRCRPERPRDERRLHGQHPHAAPRTCPTATRRSGTTRTTRSGQGQLVPNTARDAKAMLFSRLIGSFLYRPIPADVYFLANNNWVDCYCNPQCGAGRHQLHRAEEGLQRRVRREEPRRRPAPASPSPPSAGNPKLQDLPLPGLRVEPRDRQPRPGPHRPAGGVHLRHGAGPAVRRQEERPLPGGPRVRQVTRRHRRRGRQRRHRQHRGLPRLGGAQPRRDRPAAAGPVHASPTSRWCSPAA